MGRVPTLCVRQGREAGVNPPSWHAPEGTTLRLTKQIPLNKNNVVALNVTSTRGDAVVFNEGFWGISVAAGCKYHLRLFLQVLCKGSAH